MRTTHVGPALCYQGYFSPGGCESYKQWPLLSEPVMNATSVQVVVRATISGASSQSLCYQGYFNPGGCEIYKQ